MKILSKIFLSILFTLQLLVPQFVLGMKRKPVSIDAPVEKKQKIISNKSIAKFNSLSELCDAYFGIDIEVKNPSFKEFSEKIDEFCSEMASDLFELMHNKSVCSSSNLNEFAAKLFSVKDFDEFDGIWSGNYGLDLLTPIYFQKVKIDNNKEELIFIGDIHGRFDNLLKILKQVIKDDFTISNNKTLFFTGDYVDRGNDSIKVLYLLINLKLKNWDKVFLLKGNHEIFLYDDLLGYKLNKELNIYNDDEIKCSVVDFFSYLPSYLLVNFNGKFIEAFHGSPCFDHTLASFIKYKDIDICMLSYEEAAYVLYGDYLIVPNDKKAQIFLRNLKDKEKLIIGKINENVNYSNRVELGINAIVRGHTHCLPGFAGGFLDCDQDDLKLNPEKIKITTFTKEIDLNNYSTPQIFTLCVMFKPNFVSFLLNDSNDLQMKYTLIEE